MTLTQTPFLGHNLLYETRESGLRRSARGSERCGTGAALASIHSLPPPRGRAFFPSAATVSFGLEPSLEGRGTLGPPDRQNPRCCRNTGSGTAGRAGLSQANSSLIWFCGVKEDQLLLGPRDAVQLRNSRGHLTFGLEREKAHVGRRRGETKRGRGKRTQRGRKDHGGARETDTRTRGSAPSPPRDRAPAMTSAGPDAPASSSQQRKFRARVVC